MILSGHDIDAETAERWGYLNRAFDPDAIGPFVDALANRIATFPSLAVQLAKQSVNNAEPMPDEGFLDETYLMARALQTDDAQRNMRRFIELDGQSRESELRMGDFCAELASEAKS